MKHYAIRIQDREGFERRVSLGNTTLIGRQSQCDVVLSDDMISRLHLRVECIDGDYWAEDLGSSHGTYQDGVRIKRIQWEPKTVLVLADGAYRLMLVPEQLKPTDLNMRAILSTAQHLTGEFDLEHLLQVTLDHLLLLSNQDRGFIMLSDGDKLDIIAERNLVPGFDKEFSLSMSSVQQVFDTGEPIWISDVSTNELLRMRKSVVDLQLKTIYCLPLSVRGRRIGVVYLDSRHLRPEPLDRNVFEAVVGLCAIAIERVRLSEESRRNSIFATIGSVASSVVHDFRNALFLINGHAELLSSFSEDPEIQYHVEQIQASVDRLSTMSSGILELARMRPIEKSPVNLAEFLNQEIANWQTRTSIHNIALTGSGPECTANIETSSFVRVINNLFSNSLDSLIDHDVEGHIQLLWESTPQEAIIKVVDNGKGIPKTVVDKIFEPFFSYEKENGTGLGMPTVKKIVEEHDGSISVESEVDQGTTVTIHLPHTKSSASQADALTRDIGVASNDYTFSASESDRF